jgi:cysteine desulfurase
MVAGSEIGGESNRSAEHLLLKLKKAVQRYYFDYNATTPVSPEVLEAMLPAMTEVFGNPSSIHHYGQAARAKLDHARRQIATMLNCSDGEIVFTSGGTESDNLAILGVAAGGHVITTTIEHPAVLASADQLSVTQVAVDGTGIVDPDAIRNAIRSDTKLISVMHVNNELGTIQPVEEIGLIAKGAGVAFHSDGIQAAGKVNIDVRAIHADIYAISGHKIYAPKGTGALYIRKGLNLSPRLHGGSHENHFRAGTQNVPGAVALGAAAHWITKNAAAEWPVLMTLRDRLERGILARVIDAHVNAQGSLRAPNVTNIRFDGIDSEALLIALDLKGFAVSAGSACSSGKQDPSPVLLAIGLTREQAKSSLRFSLGRSNDAEQVDALIDAVAESVAHLRKLAPAYAG